MTQLLESSLFMLTLNPGLDMCFAPFLFCIQMYTHIYTHKVINAEGNILNKLLTVEKQHFGDFHLGIC